MSDNELARVEGLSPDNATLLLAAAEELGHPASVVETNTDGVGSFIAPAEVVEKAFGKDRPKVSSDRLTDATAQDNLSAESDAIASQLDNDTPAGAAPSEEDNSNAPEESPEPAKKTAAKRPAKKTAAKKTARKAPAKKASS